MKIYSMAEARAKQAKQANAAKQTGRMSLDEFIKTLKGASTKTETGEKAWWANGQ